MEFRKGDVVKFEGVVAFAAAGQVYFEGSNTASLPVGSVELVRRAFKVGERVFISEDEGVILAVHEGDAWIKLDGEDGPSTWPLSECKPIEPMAAPPAPPEERPGDWVKDVVKVLPPAPDLLTEPAPAAGETFVDGIRIPPPTPQPQANGDVPAPSVGIVEYTTVDGDTLAGIANTFETSADTIRIQNAPVDMRSNDAELPAGIVLKFADNRIPF